MTPARVAVAPNKYAKGFDGTGREIPEAYEVLDLEDALARTYSTDAHLVTYVVPGATHQSRINKEGLPYFGRPVEVNVFFCDADNPEHGAWTPELLDEATRQHDTAEVLQTAGVYHTQHGRRILQPLVEPIPVERVEPYIRRWLTDLEMAGIQVDWNCRDWTRHFRLPHVRRGGRAYQSPFVSLDRMQPIALAPIDIVEAAPLSARTRGAPRPTASVNWSAEAPPLWHPRIVRIAAAVREVTSEWHTLFLALAGALLARGVPHEQVPILCRSISQATGADARTADREAAARSTVTRRLAGHRVTDDCDLRIHWPAVADAVDAVTATGSEAHLRALSDAPSDAAVLPLAKATAALEDCIRHAPDGLTLISAECGLGKTAAAIRVAAERAAKPYASPDAQGKRAPLHSKTSISVDKNALAIQVTDDLAALGTDVRRMFGPLSVLRSNGQPECRHYEVAKALVNGHQAMKWELCKGRDKAPCEFYDECIAKDGIEGPDKARVTVGPHALVDGLNGQAGSTGLLIIDDPPDVLETTILTVDDFDKALVLVRAFEGRYAGAMTPALQAVRAWVDKVGAVEAPSELKAVVHMCADAIPKMDIEQARRSAGFDSSSTADAIDCALKAPFPKGRPGTAPPIDFAYIDMARKSLDWAAQIGAASKVFYAVHRSLSSEVPVTARIEQRAVRTLVLTGVWEPFVEVLRRKGSVVVTDANAEINAPVYAKIVGYDPPLHRFAAVDGAPIARTLIRCRTATRKQWLPGKRLVLHPSLISAVRALFDWAREDPQATRLGLITMKAIESALRAAREPNNADLDAEWAKEQDSPGALVEVREKLGPIVRSWPGEILFGHYGAVRGLNTMSDVDCLATLGDPWPNLGAVKHDVAFLGLAEAWEPRLEAMCRAELEQAHGRIRAIHRTRPGRALHVGGLLPFGSGWCGGKVQIRKLPGGRPKTTAAMAPADLAAFVVALGGARATARALGCDDGSIRAYLSGRTPIPESVATAIRRLDCIQSRDAVPPDTNPAAEPGTGRQGCGENP